MNDDNNPMHAGYRPPSPKRRPTELLFSLIDAQHRRVDVELVDHGKWGTEAQIWRAREFCFSRRFDTKELAIQWAELEVRSLEKGDA